MKIKVELSIELDAEAWDNTYGPSANPGETHAQMIRRDVREHVLNTVQQDAPFGTGEVPHTVQLLNR